MKKISLVIMMVLPLLGWTKYDYTLRWGSPNTHALWIEMEIEPQLEISTEVQLATWRPGRYIAQEYAAAVSDFAATDQDGKKLTFVKTSKNTWKISHANVTSIKIKYSYYANNEDAGSSYLGDGQVYFNPINCFMYVPNRMEEPVTLNVPDLDKKWKVATALTPTRDYKIFTANSYHEFADSPTVFADKMKQLMFRTHNATFMLHFQGDYKGDAEVDSAIVQNIRKIVAEQGAIFGGFPFKTYHFIYRLLDYDMRHAVEHANSTSLALPAKVTATPASVPGGICGISSHEFWHVWNVKRIRPAALLPYNYNQETYTGLHWFTEGVTEYYSVLSMVRSGVLTEADGLKIFSNVIQGIENNYAYSKVSPYYSSFDSWLSPSTYADPFLRNSFYSLGERLGMLIDFQIRKQTQNKKSLDDVFTYLHREYYDKGKGVPEDGIQLALENITGTSWKPFFEKHVMGIEPIDYKKYLEGTGLTLDIDVNKTLTWEKIGLPQVEKSNEGWFIKKIHPAGEGYKAGVGIGDLIRKVNGKTPLDLNEAEFFNNLKAGDKIQIEYINAVGNIHTGEAIVSGNATPKTYSLHRANSMNAAEGEFLKIWLKSKVR